jgi:hypothetical protein
MATASLTAAKYLFTTMKFNRSLMYEMGKEYMKKVMNHWNIHI